MGKSKLADHRLYPGAPAASRTSWHSVVPIHWENDGSVNSSVNLLSRAFQLGLSGDEGSRIVRLSAFAEHKNALRNQL